MRYPHNTIRINQRTAALSEIMSGSAASFSDVEAETFSFIKDWLSDRQTFTLKTSGSTGVPKEIALTRHQLAASAQRTIHKLGLSEKNTALVCLNTRYIAGKMMLVRALEANMPVVAVEPAADPLKNLAENIPAGFTALVPLQLDEIFNHEVSVKKLNQFDAVLIGGAPVNPTLLERIKTLSCTVYATYGMTETISHIALQKLNGPDAQSTFETLPGVTINSDDRGCLVIEMPGFRGPVVTNDLVTLTDDSHFTILGRYDTIINSGGIKLIPEIIEKKLSPLLNQSFFVAGIPDERLGQKLVLIIEGKDIPDLAAALKRALSAYEVPKYILYINHFVRTETQKINRLKTLEKAVKSGS